MADNRPRRVIIEYGNDALVEIAGRYLTDYVVVRGFHGVDKDWGHGVYFTADSDNQKQKLHALVEATEYFYNGIDPDYISYDRMTEIATRFKDNLDDEGLEYAMDDLWMTDAEKEFFCIYNLNETEDDEDDNY